MSLKLFQRKRKFHKTPEPPARKTSSRKGHLKFVIQKHDASRTHYDFRLEIAGTLKSWAVPKGPTLTSSDPRFAVMVEDHPIEYGRFEGVIPKGNYGAGTVMLWDRGTYVERGSTGRPDSEKALKAGLEKGHLTFVLEGEKLRGEFALIRLKKKGAPPNGWLLIKKFDGEATRRDVLKENLSVKTGRTMDQITAQAEKKGEIWTSKRVGARKEQAIGRNSPKPAERPNSSDLRARAQAARERLGREVVVRRPLAPSLTTDRPPITHPSKVYFPDDGYTKENIIDYYDSIADTILPYLIDRPQSMHRQPHGIRDQGFFHKDITSFHPRRVKTCRVLSDSSGRTINYLLCQDRWSLLYLINLGCIELNPWLSRRQHLERPDLVVIDLDPDGNSMKEIIAAALSVKKILDQIKATSFCKTSGASGLHICIPTQGRFDYDTGRLFAEHICRLVNTKLPAFTSIVRDPAKRRHKIYLDFLQNRRGQTLAAPYCVRPRPGATVSTPLKWSEVKPTLKLDTFTIQTTQARLKRTGDLWKPTLTTRVDLKACLKRLLRLSPNSSKLSMNRGFIPIFIAVGIVALLGAMQLTMALSQRITARHRIDRIDRLESAYSNELGAWHAYARSIEGLTTTSDHASIALNASPNHK
ncbi:MAG: hypothetical protein HYR96_11595 [Deltaproteobacteria bacterium]|nr:hypothetical protein [Deltaproteobacteria bacterium]MBI3294946.1 hypothetical protein [Deltaproteobacteria bacterium]